MELSVLLVGFLLGIKEPHKQELIYATLFGNFCLSFPKRMSLLRIFSVDKLDDHAVGSLLLESLANHY
jgi:hypothetical protein